MIYQHKRENLLMLMMICYYNELTIPQKFYLDEFDKIDTSDFCLAHLFTYRDFPAGVQGLAFKNTVCRKKYNTGFTTILNHEVS